MYKNRKQISTKNSTRNINRTKNRTKNTKHYGNN